MKYFIPLLFTFFAVNCFGITLGGTVSTNAVPAQTVSSNLLKAVKASTKPPPIWTGTITLGLTATEGNVNSVLTTMKINAERKTHRNDLLLESDGAYGEVSSVKNAESLHGSAQDNYSVIDNKWYAYGRGEALHDAIADVGYRLSSGVGVGYYFIKDKQTTLSAETGPAFEAEKLDDEYHNYPTWRTAENFQHKIDDHARVWENVEVITPVTLPDAFLVNAEVGIETPLTHKLSLQTYLDDDFQHVPAPGYVDNDLKLVSGLVLKF